MHVHSLTADPSGWPWVALEMRTAGGTYVRAVVESLGQRCGLPAHVASLRRLQVGAWTLEDACPLADVVAGNPGARAFLPLAQALALPILTLDSRNSQHVTHGRFPEEVHSAAGARLEPGMPFLFADLEGSALAVAESEGDWQDDRRPPRCHFERVLARPA
jgi:tRNA U55 pseudouridine synthase TruB